MPLGLGDGLSLGMILRVSLIHQTTYFQPSELEIIYD